MAPQGEIVKDLSYVHTGDKLGLGADKKNPSFIEHPDKIPEPGFLGIRWGKTNGEIANLNRLVDAKCQYFLAESLRTGEPLSPEVEFVLKTGKPSTVYKERWTIWPLCAGILLILNIMYHAYKDPTTSVLIMVCSFFSYDLFSGVLHIVLDNPVMIGVPIISEPTLEFQWHHHIPQDLTSKSFLEVCGDLNLITAVMFTLYCIPFGPFDYSKSDLAMNIISWKIFFAYFGQLCHAMSHMPPHRRPQWISSLQTAGLMVSPKEHWGHHKNYDDNYCIGSGVWNKVLTPFLKFTNKVHGAFGSNDVISAFCWLGAFLAYGVMDVAVFLHFFRDVLKLGH